MNNINMPGFTAELGLVRNSYWGRSDADAGIDNPPARCNAVVPQWTTLTCPNGSLQAICSAAFYPADFSCAWLGWFNHGAEINCAYGIMVAHFPWCVPCRVT